MHQRQGATAERVIGRRAYTASIHATAATRQRNNNEGTTKEQRSGTVPNELRGRFIQRHMRVAGKDEEECVRRVCSLLREELQEEDTMAEAAHERRSRQRDANVSEREMRK